MEISRFSRAQRRFSRNFYQRYYPGSVKLRVLIVSGNPEEATALSQSFQSTPCSIQTVTDKASLFEFFSERKIYDLVVVCESFPFVGPGFFPLYFQPKLGRHRPCLVYLGNVSTAPGFDLALSQVFSVEKIFRFFEEK